VSETFSIILASQSPRRHALLAQMAIDFTIQICAIDETPLAQEQPATYVERLAREKAQAGFEIQQACGASSTNSATTVVIGADTTVVSAGQILGKPKNQADAVRMLLQLSGRTHEVYTGVAVCNAKRMESQVVVSKVTFRQISPKEAHSYWQTGEPGDKAGGYGIQGIGSIFVERIEGSSSAVMGLPTLQTERLLESFNIDTWSLRVDGRRTFN